MAGVSGTRVRRMRAHLAGPTAAATCTSARSGFLRRRAPLFTFTARRPSPPFTTFRSTPRHVPDHSPDMDLQASRNGGRACAAVEHRYLSSSNSTRAQRAYFPAAPAFAGACRARHASAARAAAGRAARGSLGCAQSTSREFLRSLAAPTENFLQQHYCTREEHGVGRAQSGFNLRRRSTSRLHPCGARAAHADLYELGLVGIHGTRAPVFSVRRCGTNARPRVQGVHVHEEASY